MPLLNLQSDQQPDFGQLLKRQKQAQFLSLLGKTIGALHNKYRRVPGVEMPVAKAQTTSPMEQYLKGLKIQQVQQSMKLKAADRALTAEREAAMRGALLGPSSTTTAPGALLDTPGAEATVQAPGLLNMQGAGAQGAAPPALGLLNQPGTDPRRATAARALALGGNYVKAIELLTPQRASSPTIRKFNQPGGTQQTRRFDPATRTWVDMGKPTQRWRPGERGGLTTSQSRENATVDQARAALDKLGMGREAIIAASQEATATGRENPDFNPYIAGLVRQATKRKYGDDPGFERRYNFLHVPPPEPAQEAPAAGPAAALEPEGPNLWERALGIFGYGDPDAASPVLPSGPLAGPTGGRPMAVRPGLPRRGIPDAAPELHEAPEGQSRWSPRPGIRDAAELPVARARLPRGPRGMRSRLRGGQRPEDARILDLARQAIVQGADPEQVRQRLIERGLDPRLL